MSIISYTIFLLIGIVFGWLVFLKQTARPKAFSSNLLIGVFGAFVGGILFRELDKEIISIIGEFAASVGGAILLFSIAEFVRRTVKFELTGSFGFQKLRSVNFSISRANSKAGLYQATSAFDEVTEKISRIKRIKK